MVFTCTPITAPPLLVVILTFKPSPLPPEVVALEVVPARYPEPATVTSGVLALVGILDLPGSKKIPVNISSL